MKRKIPSSFREVALPWSDGCMSARLWTVGSRFVAGVPELGLHCYGQSQSEAVFRLFTSLVKYYKQLSSYKERISSKGLVHLTLLKTWMRSVENKMMDRQTADLVVPLRRN